MCAAMYTPGSASFLGLGGGEDPAERPDHEMKFEPRKPEPIFESDGGRILQWRDPMMTHMGLMDARIVTVNQQSLLLPQYANSHRLLVVINGCACMGLVLPLGMKANIRKISKGEVIAVPRGMPMWIYNDGEEPCTFLTFANIRSPMMHGRHKYEAFHLSGAQSENRMGGILHGFSKEVLTEAMDVDKQTARRLVENQDGVAIVKISREQRQRRKEFGAADAEIEGGGLMADFGYQLEKVHRDIVHPRAGQLTVVNGYKLPVLKLLDMSLGCLKLQRRAMKAPGWLTNADHMIYCVKGNARVQVVWPSGKMACDVEMKKGDMMMVPKNYPVTMQAGDDGFDAAIVMNSHMPISMHLTGKDSVFSMIKPEVRMGAFKISEELDKRVHEENSRRHTAILLPPRERSPRDGEFGDEEVLVGDNEGTDAGSSSPSMDDVREAIWSMFEVA
ncbi:hypothetical protein L7F22_014874 [Adiantum nelumboides]|nr:hypothetical protein [Adiantum nelumboides]